MDQIKHIYLFQHCPVTGMQNGDEASPSISQARHSQLVNMLITCTKWYIWIKFIFTLFSHWFAKQ